MATTLSSARRALKALGQRGQTTRIPDAVRVIVLAYAQPADLRKGFDGLYGIVTSELSRDQLDGDCFLFVNRARSRAKVLLWDGTGLCIYMKRLERGRRGAQFPHRAREAAEVRLLVRRVCGDGTRE
jgi:transposase